MNNNTPTENDKQTPMVKVLLVFVILLFLGVGGYSLYKVIIKKPSPTTSLPTNISPTGKVADNRVGTPPISPITYLSPSPIVSEIPSVNPTKIAIQITIVPSKIPLATSTPKSISTITPTVTHLPTKTISPSPSLSVSPTVSPSPSITTTTSKLPEAGFSTPTTILLILGIILIFPLISVL